MIKEILRIENFEIQCSGNMNMFFEIFGKKRFKLIPHTRIKNNQIGNILDRLFESEYDETTTGQLA